ncbi:MAG: antitoxin Xre-like helix-turn-helix domain-containing protein [Myxococcota bacterium]
MAWIAQQERARQRERTLAGLERAKASGTVLGRPRLELDADAARALIGQGYTQQRVADLLGVSRSTLQRRPRASN